MLTLTKMRRAHIIDHVMPSDLDKEDIKHGLYLKEKLLKETTDEKIKSEIPDWRNQERYYRKSGLDQYIEKISCGEMDYSDIPQPKPVKIDVWIRWKDFQAPETLAFDKETARYGFDKFEHSDAAIDNNLRGQYTPWMKFYKNEFTISNQERLLNNNFQCDMLIQLKIVIHGENAMRYYPYHSYECSSGWSHVQDLDMWFPHLYSRNDTKQSYDYGRITYKDKYGHDIVAHDEYTAIVTTTEHIVNEDGTESDVPKVTEHLIKSDILDAVDSQEMFYRLFFRHKYTDLGSDYLSDLVDTPSPSDEVDFNNYNEQYYPNWYLAETDWDKQNYPGEEVNTLYTDPFRVRYQSHDNINLKESHFGSIATLVGRQWIKTTYKTTLLNVVNFTLRIDNDLSLYADKLEESPMYNGGNE